MEKEKFEGMKIKKMEFVDMKLLISFYETEEILTISSEDKYCGLELSVGGEII